MDVSWSSGHMLGESEHRLPLGDNDELSEDGTRTGGPEDGTRTGGQVDHYHYDENYFLADPEELIYSHFPEDSRWQLLAREITLDDFQHMAYLKSHFFKFGLRLMNHRKYLIEAVEGRVCVKLGLDTHAKYCFMYHLWISNESSGGTPSEVFEDVALKKFVFMQNRGGMMTCNIQFPVAGKFKLDFFCTCQSTNYYHLVCSYVITAFEAAQNAKPYPENTRNEWGPGHDLEDIGLRPLTHHDGIISTKTGETEIRFRAVKRVEILAQLHNDKKTAEDLSGYVIHYIDNDEVVVIAKFPEKDDYVLNIFACCRQSIWYSIYKISY
jgi:hypothetical protein